MRNKIINLTNISAPKEMQRVGSEGLAVHAIARAPFSSARRILLPFDLSGASVRALRTMAHLAEITGAEIHLVHAVRTLRSAGARHSPSAADNNLAKATERAVKHWVKRIVKDDVKTSVAIMSGDPVEAILDSASASSSDLIVMTSRSFGRQVFELQRSSAEAVSRRAGCPVLTIPEKCSDQLAGVDALGRPWKRILMPVDFSAVAAKALLWAGQFANETGATLLLAHAANDGEERESELRSRLRKWARTLLVKPASCEVAIWPGAPSLYPILSEAFYSEADLIVLPTIEEPQAGRLRAGSITDGVLRQAPCPVVSVTLKSPAPRNARFSN
jgi:nucleotide-binding universal stress UspA family protein